MKTYTIRFKGGAGSGFHGHKGIPGHRGGSLPREGSSAGINDYPTDWDGRAMRPESDEMSDKEVLRDVKRSLTNLANNVRSWAARDTIMELANEYLGTDYVSLGGEEGMKIARSLAKRLGKLDNAALLRMVDERGSSAMHGLAFEGMYVI